MDLYNSLVNLIIDKEYILSSILSCDDYFNKEIVKQAFNHIFDNKAFPNLHDAIKIISIVLDSLHDNLHTGEWHLVTEDQRYLFTLATLLKVVLIIKQTEEVNYQECMYHIDLGILLGAKIKLSLNSEKDLLTESAHIISTFIGTEAQSKHIEGPSVCKKLKLGNIMTDKKCDVTILNSPTLETFSRECYLKEIPTLLTNVIEDWPAFQKWHDSNYLIEKAGSRTVPVELGSQYSHDNWSQSLYKFEDFIRQYIENPKKNSTDIAYLAQHDLFDQIPELKKDICIPEYACQKDTNPRIKAWLGPKNTVSPFHTDPTHNLLCQIFGEKKIILASPNETANLYPFEHFVLKNTSQIDGGNLDYEKFPLLRNVKFYEIILERGEILYIPPGWWHYVKSLAPSFSVSFWFD